MTQVRISEDAHMKIVNRRTFELKTPRHVVDDVLHKAEQFEQNKPAPVATSDQLHTDEEYEQVVKELDEAKQDLGANAVPNVDYNGKSFGLLNLEIDEANTKIRKLESALEKASAGSPSGECQSCVTYRERIGGYKDKEKEHGENMSAAEGQKTRDDNTIAELNKELKQAKKVV